MRMADNVQIHVLYFGVLRERFARNEEKIVLPEGAASGDAIDQILIDKRDLGGVLRFIKIAVNEDLVDRDRILIDGDVLALIPPIAGGSDPYCRLSDQPLKLDDVYHAVLDPGQGAVVTFVGMVRDHNAGKQVIQIEYEAYATMVIKNLTDIVRRCEASAPDVRVAVAHRTGVLKVGDTAVIIAASAPHRAEAFEAARTCIELIKKETPIWKKEFSPEGDEWVGLGA